MNSSGHRTQTTGTANERRMQYHGGCRKLEGFLHSALHHFDRSSFCSPNKYPHTHVTPDPDKECMICREPYDDDQAIRLIYCGHTIDLDCFRTWLSRQPNICPYWPHTLPSAKLPWLESIRNTAWFVYHDDIESISIVQFPRLRTALEALHADNLNMGDVWHHCIQLSLDTIVISLFHVLIIYTIFWLALATLWIFIGVISVLLSGSLPTQPALGNIISFAQ
jgi:hypothetical protein